MPCAENILITICLETIKLTYSIAPNIKTDPKEIVGAIKITKKDRGTTKKHIWDISLINPNESVTNTGKASDVVNFIEHGRGQYLTDTRDGVQQFEGMIIALFGGFFDMQLQRL